MLSQRVFRFDHEKGVQWKSEMEIESLQRVQYESGNSKSHRHPTRVRK